jgi:methylase of polypeptide subunit release factors
MLEFIINDNKVFYEEHLDGGGTVFGVNCLSAKTVQNYIKHGNVLEMCSGPGFMGFYMKFNNMCDKLTLSDINEENLSYINKTVNENKLENVKFIKSNVFDSFQEGEIYDTIIGNLPHFKTPRPWGYKDVYEQLISLDLNMEIHKKFFKDAKNYMDNDSRIILVENSGGVTFDDIVSMTKDDYQIQYTEYNRYGWMRDTKFYTIILKKI